MSYSVKPEDVPDELVRHHLSSVVGDSWKHKIAADINAAIESGLVSPPCHVIRRDGKLVRDSGFLCLWPGQPSSPSEEHWKGQTE